MMTAASLIELSASALLNVGAPIRFENLLALCTAYYQLPGNACGGSLHIVLDDGNIEDCYVTWCETYAREHDDQAGVLLAQLILLVDEDMRQALFERAGVVR